MCSFYDAILTAVHQDESVILLFVFSQIIYISILMELYHIFRRDRERFSSMSDKRTGPLVTFSTNLFSRSPELIWSSAVVV
jgi:hypothetical protein